MKKREDTQLVTDKVENSAIEILNKRRQFIILKATSYNDDIMVINIHQIAKQKLS